MAQDTLPSTRPYLIRAWHEWCTDHGFTPYLAVAVDASVQVPREFVKDNEIVLNTSFDATGQLRLGNDYIEFKARFGGVAREIMVPVDHVIAIYARENGQGMAFPAPQTLSVDGQAAPTAGSDDTQGSAKGLQVVSAAAVVAEGDEGPDAPIPPPTRPTLKRVK